MDGNSPGLAHGSLPSVHDVSADLGRGCCRRIGLLLGNHDQFVVLERSLDARYLPSRHRVGGDRITSMRPQPSVPPEAP